MGKKTIYNIYIYDDKRKTRDNELYSGRVDDEYDHCRLNIKCIDILYGWREGAERL